MKALNYVVALLGTLILLAGCGKAKEEPVPTAVVDQNMVTTRLNAQKNANSYFPVLYPSGTVDTKLGTPTRILMQSDSTVSQACRFGDGWASGEVQFDTGKTLKVKCQTNGTGKGINGCMTAAEFETKTYKGEEGTCQNLPNLEKF
jgi:hypothetical protein